MNKNMVETMQNDMHLFPYRDESISNYLGRLVYSALSYWIRTCIMDRMSESTDIAQILRENAINSSNVNEWLASIDRQDNRLIEYYKRVNEMALRK